MITTGIIKEINISSENYKNNKYKVEIPLFKTPEASNKDSYIFTANACIQAGFSSCYKVGDKVYVEFMNDDYSYPIIMGKIYQGVDDTPSSYASLNKLEVEAGANLPKNTQIGDITYDNLYSLFLKQQKLDELNVDGSSVIPSTDAYTHNLILETVVDQITLSFMFTFQCKRSTVYNTLTALIADLYAKFSNNVQVCFQKTTLNNENVYAINTGLYINNNNLKAFDKSGDLAIVTITSIKSDIISK